MRQIITWRIMDAFNVILIAGMHRSGTSMLTRLLAEFGGVLPTKLIPPRENDNRLGFWEPVAAVGINKEIMKMIGSHWIDCRRPRTERIGGEPLLNLQNQIVQFLKNEYPSGDAPRLVKDPRLSRTFPIWRSALAQAGANVSVVISVRSPQACAQSLVSRNKIIDAYAVMSWLRSYLEIEFSTRGQKRLFVNYDSFFDDNRPAQIKRILQFMGLPADEEITIPETLVSAEDRHHTATNDAPLQKDVTFVYTTLAALSRAEPQANYTTEFDVIRGRLNAAEYYFGEILSDSLAFAPLGNQRFF
ncbi:sulfotransferase family protein [Desulfarculus baarsii]|nr:hypothetical protein [Desulfarculus baarsii]